MNYSLLFSRHKYLYVVYSGMNSLAITLSDKTKVIGDNLYDDVYTSTYYLVEAMDQI